MRQRPGHSGADSTFLCMLQQHLVKLNKDKQHISSIQSSLYEQKLTFNIQSKKLSKNSIEIELCHLVEFEGVI